MTDGLKHECAVALVVLRKPPVATGDFGGAKLSLLLEKQHNRGQDGAGAAILSSNPEPGEAPYWMAKSASSTSLADVLKALAGRSFSSQERVFLGHLRYATFGKNDVAFCHPFVHESSELRHTLLLAGNFNLTNAHELFDDYRHHGSFPTSRSDGYLITSLIAKQLEGQPADSENRISRALATALANADGAWTLCGMTADGWAFATRDPHGIRPGCYYADDDVVVVASERAALQAAFDVSPDAVEDLPPGQALVVSPEGKMTIESLCDPSARSRPRPCSFERIYFSRANDADIHRERKALGAALLPQILEAAAAPLDDIFFSYIPNSARIAFHGLLEELFSDVFLTGLTGLTRLSGGTPPEPENPVNLVNPVKSLPRFGEIAVKDAKFRTFIADAAARREFYKHVYDVTYGLVRPGRDTLVVLDDSIVRGNTMKNAILPMLDRLGPKRIVIASSAPPIRYPDCYGIDMSTLKELVAFRALVNLLGETAESELRTALGQRASCPLKLLGQRASCPLNPLAPLYAHFTDEQHCSEIARLLTPPGMKAEVKVVYQTVDNLRRCLGSDSIGDWYFTGEYPTPGGYKVLNTALIHYLEKNYERSY